MLNVDIRKVPALVVPDSWIALTRRNDVDVGAFVQNLLGVPIFLARDADDQCNLELLVVLLAGLHFEVFLSPQRLTHLLSEFAHVVAGCRVCVPAQIHKVCQADGYTCGSGRGSAFD